MFLKPLDILKKGLDRFFKNIKDDVDDDIPLEPRPTRRYVLKLLTNI